MSAKSENFAPVQHAALVKRRPIAAQGSTQDTTALLLDVPLHGLNDIRVSREDGRLRVLADVMGHFNDFTPGQSGGSIWGWWGEEPWPRVVGVGSTIGSTAVQKPDGTTTGDNEYSGGPSLSVLVDWARTNFA